MALDLISLERIQEFAHQYGYWTVLGGIMLENAGVPLPGETIVLVGGFLAGSGELNYWLVLGSAIAGAILGDSCGYWVGVYGGWSLMLQLGRLFRIPEAQLVELKKRFSYNAPRAVFFGRFVALLRIFAGPMAGIAGMPYHRFLLYNVAGAALWGSVTVSVAFFAGKLVPLPQLVAWMTRFGVLALVAIAAWFVLLPLLETSWKKASLKLQGKS